MLAVNSSTVYVVQHRAKSTRVGVVNFFIVSVVYRRKSKYRIFGGLWFREEKPFFPTFFTPFTEALGKTEIHGEINGLLLCYLWVLCCEHWNS